MPNIGELLKNQKRMAAIALAAGILILYIVPLDQVTSAPGNGQGNSYGPQGRGPPDFVPRGPNPNPGEPRGQPDSTPPGQEKKLTINNELEKQGPQNEDKGPKNEDKGPKNEEKQSNNNVEIQSNDNNDNNNNDNNDNNDDESDVD